MRLARVEKVDRVRRGEADGRRLVADVTRAGRRRRLSFMVRGVIVISFYFILWVRRRAVRGSVL